MTLNDQNLETDNDPPAIQTQYADLYDSAITSLLTVPVTDEWVDTRDGETHVLTAGDPTAPPIVVFQGGNVTTPVTLAWVQELADDFYLIAPDTPGEPGKTSSETPHEYGPWVVDVLNGFGIDQAPMVGVSHGAGVLLEGAEYASDRIVAAALIVPAGFGTPFSVDLARIIVSALLYRFLPRRELLTRALDPMFTQSVSAIDGVIVETIGMALRTGDLAAEFPGPDSAEALSGCRAPMLVITGEDDPFFPGHRTCERAREYLPSLVECITLSDERHFLSPHAQKYTTEQIRAFLADHGDSG